MRSQPISIFAPAKVNLFLGVHSEKDASGYHRVDSVMAALGIGDVVEIAPAEALHVECVPAVGIPQESNTCWQAATRMAEVFGRSANYDILVHKHVPDRAGLGGSSSDAAATIWGLCKLWDVDPTCDRAFEVARSVGADVPFFLSGVPTFLVGAGDVVEEVLPAISGVHIALAKRLDPGITAGEAYADFDRAPVTAGDPEPVCDALRRRDADSLVARLANNLQTVAFRLMPGLSHLRDWLSELPGVRSSMVTGSGSCVFAVCDSAEAAASVADAAKELGLWAVATELIGHGPCLVEE